LKKNIKYNEGTKMKKISLALILALFGNLYADNSITVKLGMTSLDNDDGWKLENGTFAVDGVYDLGYAIKPRGELTYVNVSDDDIGQGVSSLLQIALGGQYDIDIDTTLPLTPYLFGALGYESVSSGHDTFDSLPYIQGGLGVRYGLNDRMNLVGEFRALQVFDSNNDSDDEDNEFTFFLGVNFPLNAPSVSIAPTADMSEPVAPIVEKREVVEVAQEPVKTEVVEENIILDSDDDGVTDDIDACKYTPYDLRKKVDASGCAEGENGGKEILSLTTNAPINLHIKFDTDSAIIKEESIGKIKEFANQIKTLPDNAVVYIIGYTDSSGNAKKNLALSSKRAHAVRSALIATGVSSKKLRAVGKGSANPIAPNDTPQGRAQNRRIEAHVEYK
jgi:OOP family OmpA-OmpF porin